MHYSLFNYPGWLVHGRALFEKHYNKQLDVTNYSTNYQVKGILECEMLCLEDGVQCLAANVYYDDQEHYDCHLINDLPET
jgi:hypothetical protein